jgi:hypothetical protein
MENRNIKKVLIPVCQGQVARNIFQTKEFEFFVNYSNVLFEFIVPPEKVDYYRKNYERKNITFIPYLYPVMNSLGLENFLRSLMFHSIFNNSKLIIIKRDYEKQKNYKSFIRFIFWHLYIIIFARLSCVKKLLRWLYNKIATADGKIVEFLKMRQADLLYIPNFYDAHSLDFIKAARVQKLKIIAAINSWDNLSTRGLIPIIPDRLLVQNEYMLEEAIKDHLINKDLIFITGIPQFDHYYKFLPWSKEVFYKRIGISDKNKKIILFGPPPHKFGNSYWEVLHYINNLISKNPSLANFVVLVRFYPNDIVDINTFIAEHNLTDCRNIYYSLPCTNNFSGGVNWEFNREDMLLLANSLYYSNIVANYGSTMTIDASAFDKPTINITFDGNQGLTKGGFRWAFRKTHIVELLKTQGTKSVDGYNDLEYWLTQYAENSNLDAFGREAIRRRFCYKLDGLSAERLVEYIMNLLEQ